MATILVINGPNLNILGKREPSLYGTTTLAAINEKLAKLATKFGHTVETFQSNAEYELVERIQRIHEEPHIKFVLINPAAFTHTSVVLRDALLAVEVPFIEIHLSNVYKREPFRHHSYFSDVAEGIIAGLGPKGYELALLSAIEILDTLEA